MADVFAEGPTWDFGVPSEWNAEAYPKAPKRLISINAAGKKKSNRPLSESQLQHLLDQPVHLHWTAQKSSHASAAALGVETGTEAEPASAKCKRKDRGSTANGTTVEAAGAGSAPDATRKAKAAKRHKGTVAAADAEGQPAPNVDAQAEAVAPNAAENLSKPKRSAAGHAPRPLHGIPLTGGSQQQQQQPSADAMGAGTTADAADLEEAPGISSAKRKKLKATAKHKLQLSAGLPDGQPEAPSAAPGKPASQQQLPQHAKPDGLPATEAIGHGDAHDSMAPAKKKAKLSAANGPEPGQGSTPAGTAAASRPSDAPGSTKPAGQRNKSKKNKFKQQQADAQQGQGVRTGAAAVSAGPGGALPAAAAAAAASAAPEAAAAPVSVLAADVGQPTVSASKSNKPQAKPQQQPQAQAGKAAAHAPATKAQEARPEAKGCQRQSQPTAPVPTEAAAAVRPMAPVRSVKQKATAAVAVAAAPPSTPAVAVAVAAAPAPAGASTRAEASPAGTFRHPTTKGLPTVAAAAAAPPVAPVRSAKQKATAVTAAATPAVAVAAAPAPAGASTRAEASPAGPLKQLATKGLPTIAAAAAAPAASAAASRKQQQLQLAAALSGARLPAAAAAALTAAAAAAAKPPASGPSGRPLAGGASAAGRSVGAGGAAAGGSSGNRFLDKMREKLAGGRFRALNEELYTRTSSDAYSMMQDQPELFHQYHQGFQQQTKGWPRQPVDVAVDWLRGQPKELVVADFGCGDAKLAASVQQKVHSFDLVASAPGVVACNMADVPLPDASVDVAVFSLALMGTDYGSFLQEAARVLKPKGWLWIAEVRSRFTSGGDDEDGRAGGKEGQGQEDFGPFLCCLSKLGMQLRKQDASNRMFVVWQLLKGAGGGQPGAAKAKRIDWPELKACMYKRR